MKLLSWNCRGLGHPQTIQDLQDFVKKERPDFVFLSETKCNTRKIELSKMMFGLCGVAVESQENSGGLALFWQKDLNVVLQSFSRGHIDVVVNEGGESGS